MVAKTDNVMIHNLESHPIFDIYIDDVGGMLPEHNMPCAICRLRHAVLNCTNGTFEPCWACQQNGWQLKRKRKGLLGARRGV